MALNIGNRKTGEVKAVVASVVDPLDEVMPLPKVVTAATVRTVKPVVTAKDVAEYVARGSAPKAFEASDIEEALKSLAFGEGKAFTTKSGKAKVIREAALPEAMRKDYSTRKEEWRAALKAAGMTIWGWNVTIWSDAPAAA